MIESCFCIKCLRPYAMCEIGMCDSCIKDIEWDIKRNLNIMKPDPKLEKLIDELVKNVKIESNRD